MGVTVVTSGARLKVNTSQKVRSAGLQGEWDASTNDAKNTFVDANKDEIITFFDYSSQISVSAYTESTTSINIYFDDILADSYDYEVSDDSGFSNIVKLMVCFSLLTLLFL